MVILLTKKINSYFALLQVKVDNSTNGSSFSLRQGHVHVSSSGYVDEEECRPQCALSSDPGYVMYSAIGSFFAPMLV